MECGLMDWGNVSQMNVAMAVWGCLSAAEIWIWNDHLDELLDLFITEFERCGGPPLDIGEVKTTSHYLCRHDGAGLDAGMRRN